MRARTPNRLKFAASALPERLARTSENRAKIERKSSESRSASAPRKENSMLPLPACRNRSLFRLFRRFGGPEKRLAHSEGFSGGSRGPRKIVGCPPKVFLGLPRPPRASPGRSETLLKRTRDAFGTLFDSTGRPERVPGAILGRFWVPRCVTRDRLSIDFREDFRSILRARRPANGITLDSSTHRRAHAAKQKARQRETGIAGR